MIAVGDRVSCPMNDRLYGGTPLERRSGTVRRIDRSGPRARVLVLLDAVTVRLEGAGVSLAAALSWHWADSVQVSLLETLAHAAQEGVHGEEDHEEDDQEVRCRDEEFWEEDSSPDQEDEEDRFFR